MARGSVAQDGATMTSKNGYHYTKQNGKWRLTHHIVAEEKLGRSLHADERVSFLNGNKRDLHPDNLLVTVKGKASVRQRIARLESRISELQAELDECNKLLKS